MELTVQREPSVNGSTAGALYVNGAWECWTIEDQMRETAQAPALQPGEALATFSARQAAWVASWKVYGQTAIPAGRYRVRLLQGSAKFGPDTLILENVPGYTGILIHKGSTAGDTEGCLLVGSTRWPGGVGQPADALARLKLKAVPVLKSPTEPLWITFHNPFTFRTT